ncbi:hypothetical protein KXX56_007379 [Aspergillus fumigatus]|nr:hypothetical protein KXX56_007379 [Aspergillus fumigatus]
MVGKGKAIQQQPSDPQCNLSTSHRLTLPGLVTVTASKTAMLHSGIILIIERHTELRKRVKRMSLELGSIDRIMFWGKTALELQSRRYPSLSEATDAQP